MNAITNMNLNLIFGTAVQGILLSIILTGMNIFTVIASDVSSSSRPHVVFLISEDPDNYEAPRTIPVFAKKLEREHNIRTTVLLGEGKRTAFHFPGLEVITEADLIVVFCRRVALPHDQLNLIKDYLKSGKPLVGIRTANHAFSVMETVAEGHEAWPEFVADILGCENRGYGPEKLGVDVELLVKQNKHPILKNINPSEWHSDGSIYRVAPLIDEKAHVLAEGRSNENVEPVAWTRLTPDNSRIFYTSLGYPSDFEKPQINALIMNGILWALDVNKSRKKQR